MQSGIIDEDKLIKTLKKESEKVPENEKKVVEIYLSEIQKMSKKMKNIDKK